MYNYHLIIVFSKKNHLNTKKSLLCAVAVVVVKKNVFLNFDHHHVVHSPVDLRDSNI